jgi:hypothetical protein
MVSMTLTQQRQAQALHDRAHAAIDRLLDAYRFGSLAEQVEFASQAAEAQREARRIEAS